VRRDHSLRTIRAIVKEALSALERDLAALYSPIGRRSIPPEEIAAGDAFAGVLFDPLGAAFGGAAGIRPSVPLVSSASASTMQLGTIRCSRRTATGCWKATLRRSF
jgi:hypothetical protein